MTVLTLAIAAVKHVNLQFLVQRQEVNTQEGTLKIAIAWKTVIQAAVSNLNVLRNVCKIVKQH